MLGAVTTQPAGMMQGMMLLPHTAILDFPAPVTPVTLVHAPLLTTESVAEPADFSLQTKPRAPIVTHPALLMLTRFVLLV
jgi:hypothetical protein